MNLKKVYWLDREERMVVRKHGGRKRPLSGILPALSIALQAYEASLQS